MPVEQHDSSLLSSDWEKISARHKDWRNKGKGEDQCRNEIQMELANIDRSLDALRGYAEQYKVPMLEAFARNYDLADSLAVFQNMKRREETERILAEKKRLEAEERLKNEETGNRHQAYIRDSSSSGDESTDCHGSVPEPRKDDAETTAEGAESDQNVRYVEFWVEVTPEQSRALGRFLKENGIKYGAIRR